MKYSDIYYDIYITITIPNFRIIITNDIKKIHLTNFVIKLFFFLVYTFQLENYLVMFNKIFFENIFILYAHKDWFLQSFWAFKIFHRVILAQRYKIISSYS